MKNDLLVNTDYLQDQTGDQYSLEELEILQRTPIFKGLSIDRITDICSFNNCEIQEYSTGDVIYSPSTKKTGVGILIEGRATVSSNYEGTMLRSITPSDLFGISNLYCESSAFPSTIISKTRSKIIFFPSMVIKGVIESDPIILNNYLNLLSNKILFLNKKLSNLLAGSAEKKLAVYLIENEQDSVCELNLSMTSLADMLNIGRASLYRAIDDLEEAGLIIKDSKKIIIPDVDKLIEYV